MAVVEQPKNMTDTLAQLQAISNTLSKKSRQIQIEVIHLKSITNSDTFSLDTFLASLYKKDEYTKLINYLDIKCENNEQETDVRHLLTILLTGSIEQIKIRIQQVSQLIGENIRIVLKRCYLLYKINEDKRTQLELSAINTAIETIKSINSYY